MSAEITARPDVPSGFSVTPAFISAPRRSQLTNFWIQRYGVVVETVYGVHGRPEFVGDQNSSLHTQLGTLDPKQLPTRLGDALAAAVGEDRICVLDLLGMNDLRGTKQQAVALAISESVTTDDENSRHVLVLLDSIPAPEDPLHHICKTTNVVLVAGNGDVAGIPDEALPDRDDVAAAVDALSSEPAEMMLREKLIRVPGYFAFRDEDGESLFARNWYDGRFCIHEVEELILRSRHLAEMDAIVICDSSHSPWLNEAASAAAEQAHLPIWASDEVEKCAAHLDHPARILLIAPVCHTGQTIAKLWEKLNGLSNVDTVRASAIVSTRGTVATDGARAVAGISVHYWVRVTQRSVNGNDSRTPEIENEPSADKTGRGPLTVYEFHDLLMLCGTRDEDHVPPHRGPAGDVPDTKKMLEDFGPWVATRLMDILHWPSRESPDFVLLYPDEPVVDDSEPVSETLASRLRLLFDLDTIAIPREEWLSTRDGFTENFEALYTRLQYCDDDWELQLRDRQDRTPVLLDEFVSSGRTLSLISDIAVAAGLRPPTTALTMLDLRPLDQDRNHGIDVRALYTLPRRKWA